MKMLTEVTSSEAFLFLNGRGTWWKFQRESQSSVQQYGNVRWRGLRGFTRITPVVAFKSRAWRNSFITSFRARKVEYGTTGYEYRVARASEQKATSPRLHKCSTRGEFHDQFYGFSPSSRLLQWIETLWMNSPSRSLVQSANALFLSSSYYDAAQPRGGDEAKHEKNRHKRRWELQIH